MRTPVVTLALAALALSMSAGCPSNLASHVASDTALGRVVVYRNGIAYYERRAQVKDQKITLEVPADKVNDFLKSLTVADAKTHKALPISFPTTGASRGSSVDMTIHLRAPGINEVIITYITEAPAWKPSYRVVVGDDGKVRVQGWAIVDNTSGEDWTDVRVGVGSSSALSFRYDLRSVRNVHRQTLGGESQFASAPPTGGSTYSDGEAGGGKKGERAQVITLADREIPRDEGHPDLLDDATTPRGPMGPAGGAGTAAPAQLAKARKDAFQQRMAQNKQAQSRVQQLAAQLKDKRGSIVIEGLGDPGERDARAKSLERANMLRNQLIQAGVAPARLRAVGLGVVPGQVAGVRLSEAAESEAEGEGQPVGESHFESPVPLTVAKGTSAMVSVVQKDTKGDVVYLYAADADRGNERFAFKSVRFVNPTDSTLETGPVTVYGDNRFIGEGLADPIPPKATAIIPFALDRQIVVERDAATGDRIARLVTLVRGVLTAEVQHLRTTKLKLTNRLYKEATVFVRHNVRKGWTLVENPPIYERSGTSHLFEVKLAKGETKTIEIQEATPLRRTVDLRSSVGVDLVRAYMQHAPDDKRFVEPMKKLLALHAEVDKHRQAISSLHERLGEYRARMDELHTQIVSLKSVKAGGTLLRHLNKKLEEISNRVQKATIEVVDHQEKEMLARIRFADGVAELSLPDALDKKADKSAAQ
jgi:hypothetical protein